MADEFQAGVCGGNWWNSSRSIFGSSLCAASSIGNNFAWPNNDLLDMKSSCRSNNDESGNSDDSVVLQELPKHHQQPHDSTLQMLGIGLSSSSISSTPDWNHTMMHGNERGDSSYHSILQEDLNSSLNYRQETGVDELGKNFLTITEDSSNNSFKHQDFTLGMNPITTSTNTDQSTVISSSFPMNSSFSNYPSALLQTLFDNDPPPPPPPQQQPQQQSLFTNNNQPMNFPVSLNYRPNLSDHFSPSLPKFPPLLRPSLPKQTPSSFPFTNPTSLNNMRGNLLPTMHSQLLLQSPTFHEKSSVPNNSAKSNVEEFRESRVKKSGNSEPALKRPRMETPSPLPTFKVRKEKLGDRITAIQQLVSPFGKTDTASVLHEAIEYIKFLHDQVNVLSTPYLKTGSPPLHQQSADKVKEQEGSKQDLRSRGLSLVPISSTFPVATETTTDFWTPNFGGTFR